MEVKVFDNLSEIVCDDMVSTIAKGSKVSIAAACFSMYAYKELKQQLEQIAECRFIFTSPTFVTEKAEWIRRKVTFKSNITKENMGGFITVSDKDRPVAYMPVNGFTTVDIGCERGNNSYNMVNRLEAPFSTHYVQLFESLWSDKEKLQDVTDVVIENITTVYNENAPEFIYFMTLYHVFSEFLDDISEDELPNEATGFKQSKIWNMLYDFQRDAVLAIINKLERYNGCILADSVGLGKTFTALAVMKYYENRNKSVLVLCPKKLAENWNTYKENYVNNPIATDRLNYDVLIATDCISEGQNLQDCDYLVNYDIHWNPVRIIQRFGRIDRIGSKNEYIQLVNFWPDLDLDEYINLKTRVETRMKISIMTSTGDDDLINPEEKGDLEYRKQQLKRLQQEVVDIEDMSTGISIMDLGLNEFRLDLLEYVKNNGDMDKKPKGMHAVVPATEELPEGVIFVLKNINHGVNVDNQNRIHPFYMAYIGTDGQIVCDYLNPKKMLDDLRLLCRGKKEPIKELCKRFNEETDDGKNMSGMSDLLGEAINSIIDTKEKSDIDSLFTGGGTSALMSAVSGLDDFELICFLVVKKSTEGER